jgi:hypothetical protein
MFEDILNDKCQLPDAFQVPYGDLLEKILLKDVSNMDDLVESFKDCTDDLKSFKSQGYEILIADDRIFFEK